MKKVKWHVDWWKVKIRHFFYIALVIKIFHLPKCYMPLYGNKIPSHYACVHLTIADNYCVTILHLLMENKNKEYNFYWMILVILIWRNQFHSATSCDISCCLLFEKNLQSVQTTEFVIFVGYIVTSIYKKPP